uniref:Protein kinase domain-containing protein n=1 Tax=Meloidogyne hapla TaxID=6305 RepID=A0A1I8BQ94_MELHA
MHCRIMAPVTCTTTTEDELINAPFYHGFQTAAEAEPLLPKDNGRFLVRLIEENGQLTIASLIRYHRFSQKPVNDESGACLRGYVERSHYAIYREQLTILSVIGHGEFGEVRKGKLRVGMHTIDVAIKMMITDKKGIDPNERIRFLREANIMMRLQHRNIIRLLGVVVYNDPILIVTEYAPGLSVFCQFLFLKLYVGGCLHDRLIDKKPTDKERLNYCRDICFGMAYLESKEIQTNTTKRNAKKDARAHVEDSECLTR